MPCLREPKGRTRSLDEHITEAAAMALIALTNAGDTWGLGAGGGRARPSGLGCVDRPRRSRGTREA